MGVFQDEGRKKLGDCKHRQLFQRNLLEWVAGGVEVWWVFYSSIKKEKLAFFYVIGKISYGGGVLMQGNVLEQCPRGNMRVYCNTEVEEYAIARNVDNQREGRTEVCGHNGSKWRDRMVKTYESFLLI